MVLLLAKTCCCGKELQSGIVIWAIVEIILNFLFMALPKWISEVVPHATYVIGWIVVVILANVVLFIGAKASRPAFLTLWLIVYVINVIFVFSLWIIVPLCVIMKSENKWDVIKPEIESIPKHPLWMTTIVLSLLVMLIEPVLQVYFIIVVNSLRRRIMMEIQIGFNSDRQTIRPDNEGPWKWLGKDQRQGLHA